jgi:hypothetical protein
MALPEHFGVNCPHPEELRTGDLLFPRRGGVLAPRMPVQRIHNEAGRSVTNALSAQAALGILISNLPAKAVTARYDLNNSRAQMFLYKVMKITFPDLIAQWLDMTIEQFIVSDIGKVFLETLTAEDPRDSFFVGHLAMVVREHNGRVTSGNEGATYVLEANTTDYSHYRVAVHPYCPADDVEPEQPRAQFLARGWVTRRLAMGEKVWLARPKALLPGGDLGNAAQQTLQQALADHAKALHGRPYGFFDDPRFGDPDHLYCSEYLFNVFRQAGALDIGEHRSWGWVKRYLAVTGQTDLLDVVIKLMKRNGYGDARKFFVLTPPMVWASAVMGLHWCPRGEDVYSPPVP